MAQIRPNYSEILGMISLYSPNLIESFKLVQSYINLELDGINISLIQKANVVEIHFVADALVEHSNLYENLCLSIFATFIQSMHHPIKRLTTKIQTTQALSVVRSLFHCPIAFESDYTSIVLSNEVSLKKNPTANPKLVSLLEIMAKEKIAQQASEGNIVKRLEDVFNSHENHYGNININEVSNLLERPAPAVAAHLAGLAQGDAQQIDTLSEDQIRHALRLKILQAQGVAVLPHGGQAAVHGTRFGRPDQVQGLAPARVEAQAVALLAGVQVQGSARRAAPGSDVHPREQGGVHLEQIE